MYHNIDVEMFLSVKWFSNIVLLGGIIRLCLLYRIINVKRHDVIKRLAQIEEWTMNQFKNGIKPSTDSFVYLVKR